MAISRKRKEELVDLYTDWLKRSSALILADHCGQPTQSIYQLRTKVRDAQGEFHVVKNTLMLHALRQAGWAAPEKLLDSTTAVTFCFKDAPQVAKVMLDFAKNDEKFVIKGGLMGRKSMDAAGVKALSELPPYPIVMGQVLGTIQAPAGKIAGTINAALRQIAAVVQARVDQLKAIEEGAAA